MKPEVPWNASGVGANNKVCSYGGMACGELRQLCGPDRVCPMHHRRMERWGTYDPLCIVGGEACGRGIRLYGEGKCREHHFYDDPKPCLVDGCDRVPTPALNKFVGGRCDTHYQTYRAAQRRASQTCSALDRGDCGPAERLYSGMCRKHYERLKATGSLEAAVCSERGCDVTYDTDPSGRFKAGMCNMHYLRARRGEDRLNALGLRLCPHCGDDMSLARRNSHYCSASCQTSAWVAANIDITRTRVRMSGARRKASMNGNAEHQEFKAQDWIDLMEALEYRCTYCGETFGPNELEMDHIVPLRRGGPHRLANITPACGSCNSSKKDHPLLYEWAPKLLGGKPRWDKGAPRGRRENKWSAAEWRDDSGPIPAVMALLAGLPELERAVKLTEVFLAHAKK